MGLFHKLLEEIAVAQIRKLRLNGEVVDFLLMAEQEAERIVKEQRAATLFALTDSFEKTAGELVGMVSSAATELQARRTR